MVKPLVIFDACRSWGGSLCL